MMIPIRLFGVPRVAESGKFVGERRFAGNHPARRADELEIVVARQSLIGDELRLANGGIVGDFVDRGPDTKTAIDMIIELMHKHPRTTAVMGNHEFAMAASLRLVETPEYSNWHERWLDHYGSETTFESYGAQFGELDDLSARLPDSHREFLAKVPWCVEHPEYFFVHAGLDPHMPFASQLPILRARDFSLNRPQWLCSKTLPFEELPLDCRKTVISGHVPVPVVQFAHQRILIDTTGGVEGDLSCVLLPELKVITSGTEAEPAQKTKGWKRFFM